MGRMFAAYFFVMALQFSSARAADLDLAPGSQFQDCPTCPEMVVIPPGSFEMGSDALNPMRDNEMRPEGPIHQVTLSKPFAVGRYEVTHAQFAAFIEETGYTPATSCVTWDGRDPLDNVTWRDPKIGPLPQPDEPAVCVSWNDARSYAVWLAGKTGQPYRLLSESEWEYVAKAGSTAAWPWGDDPNEICRYGNVFDRSGVKEERSAQTTCTHPQNTNVRHPNNSENNRPSTRVAGRLEFHP